MKTVLNKLKLRLPAIILLAVMFLFWPGYDPCKPVGPVLLSHPTLADAVLVEGDCAEADSVFRLRRKPGAEIPAVRFRVPDAPPEAELLRVRGRMRGENLIPGRYTYFCGRITLLRYDDTGYMNGRFDGRIYGSGTFGWSFCLSDYFLADDHDYAEVQLSQHGVSGTAWFDSIEVLPVKLRAETPWVKGGFAAAWMLIGVLYFHRCRLRTRRLRFLIVLNIVIILIGILLPSRVVQRLLYEAVQLFSAMPDRETFVVAGLGFDVFAHFEQTVGRSIGHFLLFGSLAFLVLLSGELEGKHSGYLFFVAFDVLLFGAVTESLQFLTADRTVDPADMLCNAYGVFLAIALFITLKSFRRVAGQWSVGEKS